MVLRVIYYVDEAGERWAILLFYAGGGRNLFRVRGVVRSRVHRTARVKFPAAAFWWTALSGPLASGRGVLPPLSIAPKDA